MSSCAPAFVRDRGSRARARNVACRDVVSVKSIGGFGHRARTSGATRASQSPARVRVVGDSQRSNAGASASPTAIEDAVAGTEREVAEHRFRLVREEELQRVVPASSRARGDDDRDDRVGERRRGAAGVDRDRGDAVELGGDRAGARSRACRRSSGRAWPASSPASRAMSSSVVLARPKRAMHDEERVDSRGSATSMPGRRGRRRGARRRSSPETIHQFLSHVERQTRRRPSSSPRTRWRTSAGSSRSWRPGRRDQRQRHAGHVLGAPGRGRRRPDAGRRPGRARGAAGSRRRWRRSRGAARTVMSGMQPVGLGLEHLLEHRVPAQLARGRAAAPARGTSRSRAASPSSSPRWSEEPVHLPADRLAQQLVLARPGTAGRWWRATRPTRAATSSTVVLADARRGRCTRTRPRAPAGARRPRRVDPWAQRPSSASSPIGEAGTARATARDREQHAGHERRAVVGVVADR